jgi:thiol-disulfide isomerase/thioredoxin
VARVRAPELRGRGWTGTDRSLSLRSLRGRVVLLDFWTAGCVHCVHALADLRRLEDRFGDDLVVLGVHSPKFDAEAAPGAVAAAAARLGVTHPVLDDADRETWEQYAVRVWPTLVVVDPEGYVVHTATGEGHADALAEVVAATLERAAQRGTLVRGRLPYRTGTAPASAPGGLAALPDGSVLACDPAAGVVRHLEPDLAAVRRVHAGLTAPRGVAVAGDRLLVADAGAHRVLVLPLPGGPSQVLAGSGTRRRPGDPVEGPAQEVPLSAPWDVAVVDGAVVVATAGSHQLWRVAEGRAQVLAGTGAEQLRDGPAERAYLAQPSALAPGADRLWFVDAESSALRWYRDGRVGTAVGTGLLASGDVDGPAAEALLQHPEGVAVLPDGAVAVADTYNGAVRCYDPVADVVTTLVRGLDRPTGLAVRDGVLLAATADGVRVAHAPDARRPRPPGGGRGRSVRGSSRRRARG